VPEVQAYYKQLTERFIHDWDFDGHKLDNIYAMPRCYNPAHHHKSQWIPSTRWANLRLF
jgi:alpha-galactosidase